MKVFHPLLALIASATDRQLARYVEFLKEENKILRSRLPGQVQTKPGERQRLLALGKALGQSLTRIVAQSKVDCLSHSLNRGVSQ
jgi:putative transposase